MPVAIVLDFKGATLDQYDDVIKRMGLTPGGPGAPGSISHFVTKTGDGFRVVDVWETKEQFDQFAQDQIGPHTQAAGITDPPDVQFHDVHNYLTKG